MISTSFDPTMHTIEALDRYYFDVAENATLYNESGHKLYEFELKPGKINLGNNMFVYIYLRELLTIQIITDYTVENHTDRRMFVQ